MTIKGGIDVEAIIQRHCVFSPKIVVPWNATDETNPNMIPNAVHLLLLVLFGVGITLLVLHLPHHC